MIKINLLPQKRAKGRRAGGGARTPSDTTGTREFAIGMAGLAAFAAIVFFAVDAPKRSHLNNLRDSNENLQQQINQKNKDLDGYAALKQTYEQAQERAGAINRLLQSKVVPAHVLHELGEILTLNHLPTMTEDMAKKTGNGPESDPNKRFDLAWDPAHVWLLSYVDKGDGKFTIDGGAQDKVDVAQFSKRLAASVYFAEVAPSSEERLADKENGIEYYKFTITGKVAY